MNADHRLRKSPRECKQVPRIGIMHDCVACTEILKWYGRRCNSADSLTHDIPFRLFGSNVSFRTVIVTQRVIKSDSAHFARERGETIEPLKSGADNIADCRPSSAARLSVCSPIGQFDIGHFFLTKRSSQRGQKRNLPAVYSTATFPLRSAINRL